MTRYNAKRKKDVEGKEVTLEQTGCEMVSALSEAIDIESSKRRRTHYGAMMEGVFAHSL